MIDFLTRLQWWHWWIAAAVLAAAETFLPGAVAIWFAASAVVVGMLVLVLPLPWQLQLLLFGVLGLVAVYVWRRYDRGRTDVSDQPLLNQRAQQYVGRESHLSAAIVDGRGKVHIGDGAWTVRGPDLPAGARVRVIAAEGTILVVEAA
jgi:inner membrane protein